MVRTGAGGKPRRAARRGTADLLASGLSAGRSGAASGPDTDAVKEPQQLERPLCGGVVFGLKRAFDLN